MRIAIVHYHLQPCGVTRVIKHILEALSCYSISLVVLTGQPPSGKLPCKYCVIPGLQYEPIRPHISASDLARDMEDAAKNALGSSPDIWHIHNHCLGKNLALPGALTELASRGNRLLLHIHDFAEDGRPANYAMMLRSVDCDKKKEMSRLLYPRAGHVHYAVLNSRDYKFLTEAEVAPDCLHFLPNAVKLDLTTLHDDSRPEEQRRLWLYPTRAIRRKNLGEFLLWSAVAPVGHRFATTLGPENPQERARYLEWIRLAEELDLPVDFEMGANLDCSFEEVLQQSRSLVTTSVAEGFGLAFLEPWLVNRPVCGRDLPEITDDFRKDGIILSFLYDRLDIPVEWIGLQIIVDRITVSLKHCLLSYGRAMVKNDIDILLGTWIRGDYIDFGRLNEEMQEIVLRKIVNNPGCISELSPNHLPASEDCTAIEESNRTILREKYSLSRYGKQLLKIYEQLTMSPVAPLTSHNGEILLDHFLAHERLTLLRMD